MTASPVAPIVFADANVLYASAPRDILIELALADIIELRWSPIVLDELCRALVRTRPDYTTEKALRLVAAMTKSLPDALVIPPDDHSFSVVLPDPDDAHVLSAAHFASCDVLLTFNLKHFPADAVDQLVPPIAVTHPDAFMLKLLTTQAAAVLPVVETVRQNLTDPPMSVSDYADSLARSRLTQTAHLLQHLLPT
jgi:hypothetical protein